MTVPSSPSVEEPTLLTHAPSVKERSIALGLLVLEIVILYWQSLHLIGERYLGGWRRDAGLYVWLSDLTCNRLGWASSSVSVPAAQGVGFIERWFLAPAFYPYGLGVAWSDNFFLPGTTACALQSLGASTVTAYNLTILGALLLNGWCSYRLTYTLTGHQGGSLFAGVSMASAPPLAAHLGHPQLLFFFWLPLGVDLFVRYFQRGLLRYPCLAGLCLCGAFLSSVYYAVFLSLLLPLIAISILLVRPHLLPLKRWFAVVGAGALGALPTLPFILPYFKTQGAFGARNLYEPYFFAASGASFFSTTPLSWLYSWSSMLSHDEARLFPGAAVHAVFAVGILYLFRGSNELRSAYRATFALCVIVIVTSALGESSHPWRIIASITAWLFLFKYLLLHRKVGVLERTLGARHLTNRDLMLMTLLPGVVFLLIALGPLGKSHVGEWTFSPFRVAFETWPGFAATRAIGRAGIVAVFCFVITAAQGLALLHRRTTLPSFVFVILLLFVVVEGRLPYFQLDSEIPAPSVLSSLPNAKEDPGAIIFLPFAGELTPTGEVSSWGDFAERNVIAMNWGLQTGREYVNGYSGQRTAFMRKAPRELRNFPDARSLDALASVVGLKYIVFTPSTLPTVPSKSAVESALQANAPSLDIVARDEAGNYLLRLHRERTFTEKLDLTMPLQSASLTFEAKEIYDPSGEPVVVEVLDTTTKQVAQVATLSMPRDGIWHSYTVTFSHPSVDVSPRKITLKRKSTTGEGSLTVKQILAAQ